MWVAVPWEINLRDVEIVAASPSRVSTTYISAILPIPYSCRGTSAGGVRRQNFHLPSTEIPIRRRAFRVMLGLFISYKDVIRQISSADTRGCVLNGSMLPRW